MKHRNSTITNIFDVAFGNVITLASGIIMAFALPKVLSIEDYGLYKIFTLYISYIGLFHLGIPDGVHLKFAGIQYNDIDRRLFRSYTQNLFVLETLVSLIVMAISAILFDGNNKLVAIYIAIYLILHNMGSYYQMISQVIGRFDEFAKRNIIYSILRVLALLGLWIIGGKEYGCVKYEEYILALIIIEGALFVTYAITYKEISIGESREKGNGINETIGIARIGFPVLVTNLVATLILAIDRQFVSVLFTNKEYAIYAFAYSMLSLVTTATSAIATVLYPKLKVKGRDNIVVDYSKYKAIVLIVVFVGLLVYFPMNVFVKWYLPKYIDSLKYFRIIFPGLAISSSITIIMYNYYKVIDKVKVYFAVSAGTLMISILANYIAYVLFGSMASISWASIITMVLWYVLSELYFVKHYGIKDVVGFLYLILMTLVFYLCTRIDNIIIAGISYALFIFVVTSFLIRYKGISIRCFKIR